MKSEKKLWILTKMDDDSDCTQPAHFIWDVLNPSIELKFL